MPFGRYPALLATSEMLSRDRRFVLQVEWVFDAFSPFNSVSPLLSCRVFIEAPPIGTKEPPSLMPALAGPLKLTLPRTVKSTAIATKHVPQLGRDADLFARPISTAAWAFNEDTQFCTTVASTKVWPIKSSYMSAHELTHGLHVARLLEPFKTSIRVCRRHEERVIDSSISGDATHRPGLSRGLRTPADQVIWLSLIGTAIVAGRLEVELERYQPADVGLELPPAHTVTILDPGVRCDSAADLLPDPQYTLLFTPLGDKDTKITQSLSEILFVCRFYPRSKRIAEIRLRFKKELVLMDLVADGAEPRLPDGHIEKERIEADADLAANWVDPWNVIIHVEHAVRLVWNQGENQ
ncbi:uncharacterized protein F5147DRAFT_652697 [Suillus discolor]|uniref:Uncharacterized protein n=1 Tax=Suillus discolor TaxID=1912936 RepID=A0A9P7JTY5_9AGAM|nr:uncharacterized protein F5147DRAFT_652697 [Suillus discolor]KAG2108708.1 hypothetical protein F5147DRAFT_652697 [Suillus discolor]